MATLKKKGKLSDLEDGQSEVGDSSSCESISGSWSQLSSTSAERYEAGPSSSSSNLSSSPEQSARFDSTSPVEPRQNQDQLGGIHFGGRRSASLDYLPPSPLQPLPPPLLDRNAHQHYPVPSNPTHLYSNEPPTFQTETNFPSSSIRHNYSSSLPTESQYWDGLPTPTTAGSFSDFQQAQESHSFPTRVTVSSGAVLPPPTPLLPSNVHFPPYQYHSNPSPSMYYDPSHQSQPYHNQQQVPLVPVATTSNYDPFSFHPPSLSNSMLEQNQPFQFNPHQHNLPYPNPNSTQHHQYQQQQQETYHPLGQQDLQQYSISNPSRQQREVPLLPPIATPRISQLEWEFEQNRNNDEGDEGDEN